MLHIISTPKVEIALICIHEDMYSWNSFVLENLYFAFFKLEYRARLTIIVNMDSYAAYVLKFPYSSVVINRTNKGSVIKDIPFSK